MQLVVIDMLPVLNIAIVYLIGMMVYAIISGNILFWGGWKNKIQEKGMYYTGLLCYGIVLFTINLVRTLEEARLLQ